MTETARPDRGFAEVHGARLYYEVAGEGHPLVLIHAGIADSRMCDDQFGAFAQHYRVIRYDVRGFGHSAMPAGPFSHHADLLGLLKFLGVDRTYLVGVSIGGAISIDFTLAYPAMVDVLVPVASGVSGNKRSDAIVQAWAEIDAAAEAGDLARAVELELRMWVDGPLRSPDQVDPAIRERVREMNAHNFTLPTDQGTLQPLDPPAISRLEEIRVPTLIIVGDQDRPEILATADLLAAGIADAQTVVMRGVAHVPNMERPQEFNQIVLDFLSKH